MGSKRLRWLVAACALAPALFGQALPLLRQDSPVAAPLPSDPLELAGGSASAVDTASRTDVLQLLQRAKSNYDLRSTGQTYDLKITFTVNSGGKTEHDGAWEMEDTFDPRYGLRWTAKDSAAYAITRISNNGMLYGEETGSSTR